MTGDQLFTRADARALGRCLLASLIVGGVAGVVWQAVAPKPRVIVVDGKLRVETLTEAYAGADMTFVFVVVSTGLIVALAGYLLFREGAVGALLGCALGGVVGSAFAWRVGEAFGPQFGAGATISGTAPQVNGAVFDGPISLYSHGALAVWPLIVGIVFGVGYGFKSSRLRKQLLASYGAPAKL